MIHRRSTPHLATVSIVATICVLFGVGISLLYVQFSTRKDSIILDPESRTAFVVDTQPYGDVFSKADEDVNIASFGIHHLLTDATLVLPDYIAHKPSAELRLTLKPSPQELLLRILCASCSPRLPDLSLYVPGIEHRAHMVPVQKEDKSLLVYADRIKKERAQDPRSIQEVIPMGSTVLVTDDAREYISFQELQNSEVDFLSTPTEIPFQLEGDAEFYVRAGTQLTLRGTKINSNSRTGTDGCTIQVLDLNGNVLATESIADDGNTQGNRAVSEQSVDANFSLPLSGIFMVRIRAAQNTDFVLSEVSLNTNRISFEQVTLHSDEVAYAHIDESRVLTLTPARQTAVPIQITNTNTGVSVTVALDAIVPNELMRIPLEPGTYTIAASTTIHFANASFAGTAETLFAPFIFDFTKFVSDADAVVTRAQVSVDSQNDGRIVATRTLNTTELQSLQSASQDTATFQFVVKPSPEHATLFARVDTYPYREVLCGGLLSVYSAILVAGEIDPVVCDDESTRENQARAVGQALPADSGVTFDSAGSIGPADFFIQDAPTQYSNATQVIDTHIQGSSRFVLYSEGELNVDIVKQELNVTEGSDEVLVTLTSAEGEVLFSRVWADSGDRTPSGIVSEQVLHMNIPNTHGISFLDIRSLPLHNPRNDIRIPQITLNTNIVMLSGTASFYAPTSLYLNVDGAASIHVERVGDQATDARLSIDGDQTITLSEERPGYTEAFEEGAHTLTLSTEGMSVTTEHAAFSADGDIEYSRYYSGIDALVTDVPPIDFKLYSGLFSY